MVGSYTRSDPGVSDSVSRLLGFEQGEYDCDMGRPAGPAGEGRILSEIISTVGSSLELDEVLGAVVRLLSEASAVHACFVYFVEDDGERMVLRAASEPYADLVGEIALERGEGLAWWVVEQLQGHYPHADFNRTTFFSD